MQPAACMSSRFYPDGADRSEAAGLFLPVEETAQENVQMGRGKRHQSCESAAGHRVGIQGSGCGYAERLDCTSRENSCSRPVAAGSEMPGQSPGASNRESTRCEGVAGAAASETPHFL
jgi:hypothetical protein